MYPDDSNFGLGTYYNTYYFCHGKKTSTNSYLQNFILCPQSYNCFWGYLFYFRDFTSLNKNVKEAQ